MPEELWIEACNTVQEAVTKTIPKKKKCKKEKWLLEEALQIAEERREGKGKGERERYTQLNRVLSREHTGHSKHPLPKTQETTLHMDITRWSIPRTD